MGQEGISEVGLADFPGINLPQASLKLAIVYKTSLLFMTAATLTVWHTALFSQLTLFIVPSGRHVPALVNRGGSDVFLPNTLLFMFDRNNSANIV